MGQIMANERLIEDFIFMSNKYFPYHPKLIYPTNHIYKVTCKAIDRLIKMLLNSN